MSEKIFKYSNEDITVTWQPEICQHSSQCWKGLIEVFDPGQKPWIKMGGATTEQIIEQVKKCPSGALKYIHNSTIQTG